MATEKISAEARKRYSERIREYKLAVDSIESRILELEKSLLGQPKFPQEGADPESLALAASIASAWPGMPNQVSTHL
jgi:hypothetical protein